MKIAAAARTVHLAYCSNVHPSEDLSQIQKALREVVLPLKATLAAKKEFGLGLYLPAAVVRELSENEYRRWELDNFLKANGLYVFTLNAFPFGGFHDERVKEKVFEPDWATAERLDHTKRAADLLARWLPEGVRGSISTHTGSYGHRDAADAKARTIAEQFARAALHLHRIEEKTGRRIVLSLEPEPFAMADTTQDFLAFYREGILHHGGDVLKKNWGMKGEEAESLLRRYLGICFDTCHLAVQYEDLRDSLRRLQEAGIVLGKAQLSAGLEWRRPPENREGLERIRAFAEPRYFHQAVLDLGDGRRAAFADLPEALAAPDLARARRLRSHFHVPIFWEGDAALGTTRGDLEAALPDLAAATDYLEIETYTWDVIPEKERASWGGGLVASLEKEYRWVLARIGG